MATIHSLIPTLRVAKVEKALPLYDALGFSVAWQHQLSPEAPRLTCIARGPFEIFLTEHDVAPFGSVVHFMVTGLEELVGRALAQGFEPTFGPENRPWGDREAYFTDEGGNVLRFGETIE